MIQNTDGKNVTVKIIKRLNPRLAFCIRITRADGVELDVFETSDKEEAVKWFVAYRNWLSVPNGAALIVIDGLLRQAISLNEKIVKCGDQQGSENYATKSHMRKWADDAVSLMDGCLDAIREFKEAPRKTTRTDPPFVEEDFNQGC